jgi:hypothetical protein
VTAGLPRKPDPVLQDVEGAPVGAQWRLSRVEFLQGAFAMVDELAADNEDDEDREDGEGESESE